MNSPPLTQVEELAELGYRLMYRLFQEARQVFSREGLSLKKGQVLDLLARGVNLPSLLAEGLEVHPSQVSQLLADLEAEGLVQRQPNPKDRRRVLLELTPKGKELRDRTHRAWLQVFARHLARLTPEEIQSFRHVLGKLVEVEDA